MSQDPVRIEDFNDRGVGLAIEFSWREDRFAHGIYFLQEGEQHPLLKSVEGVASDTWPASPPLQQISAREIAGDPAIMGVGMAGHSHWSASCLLKTSDDGQLTLLCELACLTKTPARKNVAAEAADELAAKVVSAKVTAPRICSNYEVFDGWNLLFTEENAQYCRFASEHAQQNQSPLLNTEFSSVNPTKIAADGNRLTLMPSSPEAGSKTAVQWGYRIWLP